MKKQITTAVAIALVALTSSSFAVAGALDFNSIADADILAGGGDVGISQLVEIVDFDSLADADILAGTDVATFKAAVLSEVDGCNHLADADILAAHTCPTVANEN